MMITSCAYYGDMHGDSTIINARDLSQHKIYRIPKYSADLGWWNSFNDPQLNQLIELALAKSPDILIAQDRIHKAQAVAQGSAANLWPNVDLSGYLMRERFAKFGLVPPPFNGRIFNIGELGLNFNYEFDFWGKNRNSLAASVSEECAAIADYNQARLIISTAVANTYYLIVYNNHEQRLASSLVHATNRMLNIIHLRATHQIESDIPVKSIIAVQQNAKLTLEYYKQAQQIAKHQLAALIADNAFTTIIENKNTFAYPSIPQIPTFLPANLISYRPDIQANRARVEAAAYQIKVSKARFFPNINLAALFSYQSVRLGKLFDPGSQNNFISGAIDLPIFDAGARRAALGVSYATYDESVNLYNKSILTALRQVADANSMLRSLTSELNAQSQAVDASAQRYALIRKRYKRGITEYLDVLDAKSNLLQLKLRLYNYKTQYIQATIALYKALGGQNIKGQIV